MEEQGAAAASQPRGKNRLGNEAVIYHQRRAAQSDNRRARLLAVLEALLLQSQASLGGRRNLTRVLKALWAHEESADIFEAACPPTL